MTDTGTVISVQVLRGARRTMDLRGRGWSILVLTASLLAGGHLPNASASVREADDTGFHLLREAQVASDVDAVWSALVGDVGRWWPAAHTYSGASENLTIDARPGGCFCEALPGGGVEHLRVAVVWPGRELRMLGGLGPLQPLGVGGALSVQLTALDAGGTRVRFEYRVSGRGLDGWAEPVDGVIGEQLDGLVAFLAAR